MSSKSINCKKTQFLLMITAVYIAIEFVGIFSLSD